ncbi:MAG TPA: hypothetical protein VIW03_05915, partial [Anaeromyxobacter sp.]
AASVLVACLAPCGAQAATSVAVYPPKGAGVSEDALADVQSVLESALRSGARRGVLVPATPLVLPASCPEPAQDACLAKLAGAGRVLHARVKTAGSALAVLIALVDADGRRSKSVGFGLDTMIMSSLPAQQALAALETLVEERAPATVATATPAATPTPTATTTGTATTTPPPSQPDLRAPVPPDRRSRLAMRDPEPPRAAPWQARAGKWTALGGLGLLALGGVVGYLDQRLSDDLTKANATNQLTASDRSRYDRVKTYNLAANVLFATGGAAVATGLVLWAVAPEPDSGGRRPPPRLGVQGRF